MQTFTMNSKTNKITLSFLLIVLFHFSSICYSQHHETSVIITAPSLDNNPSFDVICTNNQPLLTFYNAKGGIGKLSYRIQISLDKNFKDIIVEYDNIKMDNDYITSKLIEVSDKLKVEKQYYYWRVKAIDSKANESAWASSRFFLDTKSDDSFMNLKRIKVESVLVSGGSNSKNIIDITDIGNTTHWEPPPPGNTVQWVEFTLEEETEISRIWMLSNPNSKEGWITNFYWMKSLDGENWTKIDGTIKTENYTFRNILDFQPVKAKYLKLLVKDYYGYAPQLFTAIFYLPGIPDPPLVPEKDYVLIVGDQLNGFTFTELAKHVEALDLNLSTLTIPHYEVSLSMLELLNPQPVAIIFSGNNANYPNLPMYEFNGGFEIVRNSDIPILGICAGHQLQAMAFGFTYAHSTGWFDNTIMDIEMNIKPDSINIIIDSPVFKDIPDPFFGVEIHSWATAPEVFSHIGFEVLAKSSYVQAQKIKGRMIFGEQFHAEIDIKSNQAQPMIYNFLKMALEVKKVK